MKSAPIKLPAKLKPPAPGSHHAFPIVGLGASAGGLEALGQFLKRVPTESGLAFVIVQHLDPTHKGIMPELLQRATAMKVVQVKDRTRVQPNCVYVIPPNKDMSLLHGVLHLQRAHEEMQTAREEMQTSQDELKSMNEELQSTNEELQSTNEEFTTSKEEMQSLNEELQTVNAELQAKVDELTAASNGMKNLLNSTEIATVFLDNKLMVRRFTEKATRIIKLIPGDVGRPVTDLASNLLYPDLADDAREVLRSLVSLDKPIATRAGGWYAMRLMPYRTMDDRIDGVVITFTDITAAKKNEAELRAIKAGGKEAGK